MKQLLIAALIAASLPLPALAQSASDFSCANFTSQTEAQRFFDYNRSSQLDADDDSIACEHMPYFVRSDGTREYSGSVSNRWNYELWRSDDGVYAKAWSQDYPNETLFTTQSFASQSAARAYLDAWFW